MSNSVPSSSYLRGYTDDQIRAKIVEVGDALIQRAFPGFRVKASNLAEALRQTNADFHVAKMQTLFVCDEKRGLDNPDAEIKTVSNFVTTVRTDTMQQLGVVGSEYGVVQTAHAMQAVDILAKRGDVKIVNVETVDNGARVRVTVLLGTTTLQSAEGAPNTLCHFGVFEATHDGSACTTAALYTLRVQCFNGMTSRTLTKVHKLRHTSLAADRVDAMTEDILTELIGDIETEKIAFQRMIDTPMSSDQFSGFATELLGGELDPNAGEAKKTRRANAVAELTEYFEGGNQGAGPTAWGAYNSVTRWIEAKREGIADAKKAAGKFASQLNGANQSKISKALKLLTR